MNEKNIQKCRDKAKEDYQAEDIQIDDDAFVAVIDDNHAWVAAWVYVALPVKKRGKK